MRVLQPSRSLKLIALLAAVFSAAFFYWFQLDKNSIANHLVMPPSALLQRTYESTKKPGVAGRHNSLPIKQSSSFAQSLQNTARDGTLRADAEDNLVIERGLRDLFDYYLTTLGERDLAAIRRQLLDQFRDELPPLAAQQATQLLEAYLRYREQSGELQDQYPSLTEENAATIVTDYLQQRDDLRHSLFDAESYSAFFSADAVNEESALVQLTQIAGQKTPPRKTDNQPKNTNEPQDSYSQYRNNMRAAKQTGAATSINRDALRSELFGHEAAMRFATLDEQRDNWQTRLANYRNQQQMLITTAQMAGTDPTPLVQELQLSHFDKREILRVRALDRLEQVSSSLP